MHFYRQPSNYRQIAAMTVARASYRHTVTPLYIRGDGDMTGDGLTGKKANACP